MPKRVIDFDAMWGSDKLAACAEWAQAEYAWLYGLADASGCFELTNLRVIWGRVAAVRRNLTIERLEQIFDEFRDKGLLFIWEHEGKRYGHWTGSDVPGRLPPPSWRVRLEKYAPPVPRKQYAEYASKFSRGRAALASGLKAGVEEAQAQDWDLNWNENQDWEGKVRPPAARKAAIDFSIPNAQGPAAIPSRGLENTANNPPKNSPASFNASPRADYKSLQVEKDLRVGAGPVCAPGSIKPEVLERIRKREAERAASRAP
jgi:hypothetical protein